ncbi:MAG TPA: tyrosine-type recombinase/integrase [Ferruginibacter sp.]|nr:tyrosine-type recombinase/integrase [Ferruginibacter sp.]
MVKITLKPLLHNNQECIGLYFKNNATINNIIKKQKEVRWSQTQQCWYFPLGEDAYETLKLSIKDKAAIDNTALREYLQKKKLFATETPASTNNNAAAAIEPAKATTIKNIPAKPSQVKIINNVSTANLQQLQLFTEMLKLKAYSSSTIRTYRNEFLQLLQILKNKEVQNLTANDLKRYMVYAMEKQGISEHTAHSRLNSLKFYFEQVLGREKFFWEIPRPKKPQQLPKLLNEEEIRNLFNALSNKKHKAMLFTAYSAGLRVSEIVNLKIAHIDSKRMQVFIERGKGKKDRYVNLSPVLLDILRNYIKAYKPTPRIYLFESEQSLQAYPIRTVQQIFTNAKQKAGIKKDVGVHSLRHSFATHLLDKGTDIKYIKDLLGHFDIRTTERYLHVTKQQLVNIISPFDDLWKNEKIDW